MQLSDYALVLRRRWWVIVLTVLAAAMSAYIFSKVQTPLFRSEATYGLTPSRFDNGLSIVLQNSMNSIRDAALARPQLQQISDNLQIDRSPDWLLKYVTIQPRPDFMADDCAGRLPARSWHGAESCQRNWPEHDGDCGRKEQARQRQYRPDSYVGAKSGPAGLPL